MHSVYVGCKLTYEVRQPTTLLLNVAIASTPHQSIVIENLTVTPFVEAVQLPIGAEQNRFNRLRLDPGQVQIVYEATANLSPLTDVPPTIDQMDFADLPPEVMQYLNPSRYCESDRLSVFAYEEFGQMPQNFERVTSICDWINGKIEYAGGTTNSLTTACDVLLQRKGVCRDFAHLAITFCRALGIPARYVSGYACRLEPPDFHGFFEAYLDGNWFLFDATRLAPAAGLVRIGAGRDAADVAFATILGNATLTEIGVWANEGNQGEGLLNAAPGTVAISTA